MLTNLFKMLSRTGLCADTLLVDGHPFALASELDAAMASNAAARVRYLAIYGVEWTPIGGVATPVVARPSQTNVVTSF